MATGMKENRAAGIIWMLATMFCFITLDAIIFTIILTVTISIKVNITI